MNSLGLLLLFPLLSLAIPGKYTSFNTLNDIKLPNPLEKIDKVSAQKDCEKFCIKHDNCTGFAFSPFERVCELYQITPGSQQIPRSGSKLYIRSKDDGDGGGDKRYDTTYIKLVSQRKTFKEANRTCLSLNGYPVAVKSEKLNELLVTMAKERNVFFAFIGVSDQETEKVWKYTDGSNKVVSYNNFREDSYWYRRDRNCVQLKNDGRWQQKECNAALSFFCQIPMF